MLYKLTSDTYESILATGKYIRIYKPGTVVTAVPHTIGLMLFDSIDNIKSFISYYYLGERSFRVLEVNTMGRITIPNLVCGSGFNEKHINDFYCNAYCGISRSVPPPNGTVCCDSVFVIKDITFT